MATTATDTSRADVPEGLRLAGWGSLALAVALVRDRVWATPNLPFFGAISRNLGRNPFPHGLDGDYLLTNLLGPTVARALGQTADHEYARLHLVLLLSGLALVVAAVHRRFGYPVARTLVWVLAASPALTVCLQWLGQPDAFTLPLALGLVVVRRRWAVLVLAVLLGLNHPEQGLVAAALATAIRPFCGGSATAVGAEPPQNRGWWRGIDRRAAAFDGLALVGGVAIGRGITQLYLELNDIVVSRPRTSYLCLGVRGFADFHLTSPLALVVNFWGPLWLALGWITWRWWRDRCVAPWWPLVLVLAAGALAPVAVTLDETRVYSLTTAPLLLAVAIALSRTRVTMARRRAAALAAAGAIVLAAVPGGFSAGEAYWATALRPTEFARFLVDGSVPRDQPVAQWLLSPFGFHVPPSC